MSPALSSVSVGEICDSAQTEGGVGGDGAQFRDLDIESFSRVQGEGFLCKSDLLISVCSSLA